MNIRVHLHLFAVDSTFFLCGEIEIVKTFFRILRQLEIALLAAMFIAMVLLGLAQIGLRNFAGISPVWIDPALRALVLWTAMVASILAAGELRHIRIDVIERMLPQPFRMILQRLVLVLTSMIAFYLGWLAWEWVRFEMPLGGTAFLSVPVWVVQFIVPVAFVLMGSRFLSVAVFWPREVRERMP